MPTGYTAEVGDGKVTEFRDFALQCARAFGALIEMRDEPSSKPIPESFPARTSYYDESYEDGISRLADLRAMSADDLATAYAEAKAQHDKEQAEYAANKQQMRERYEAMLSHVTEWTPPSPDHEEMKKFMREQLMSSIDFDCKIYPSEFPATAREWFDNKVNSATRSVQYATEERSKEIERTASRNLWVKQLRESLS